MVNKLDMRGKPCPIPVVEAKKVLANPAVDGVEVAVDNIVAVQNLEKMAKGLGYAFSCRQENEKLLYATLLRTSDSILPAPATQQPAAQVQAPGMPEGAPTTSPAPVVLITSDTMGRGSDDLGRMLIKGFLFSLTELAPLPKAVIFLNGGAHLTTEGANTVPDLQVLENHGCEILTCGTCANYYELSDKLAVGSITDMMGIASRVAAAGHLISI